MPIDSSQAGYLDPTASPLEGDALNKVLHDAIVGLTGINGKLVRPRWVPEPSTQPSFDENWVAFGIPRTVPDYASYEEVIVDGVTQIQRDELLFVLHSFYGPNCKALAERMRNALDVSQNRAALRAAGLLFKEAQEPVVLPALLKEKWVKRVDITIVYARRAIHTYAIRIIESGQLGLDNEHYVTPIQTPTN